jgi:DNA-binding GntR family transcriptional regulator
MEKIVKHTLRDEVTKYLREAIIKGELKPGDRIVETKLANDLGVSQAPVREAIRELQMMGLLTISNFSGCSVKKITEKDIIDEYKLRALIESFAIKIAMDYFNEEKIEELKVIYKKMIKLSSQNDFFKYWEAEIEFHKYIVYTANMSNLTRIWEMVEAAQWTTITMEYSDIPIKDIAENHLHIIELIQERNVEGAVKEIKEHIEYYGYKVAKKIADKLPAE